MLQMHDVRSTGPLDGRPGENLRSTGLLYGRPGENLPVGGLRLLPGKVTWPVYIATPDDKGGFFGATSSGDSDVFKIRVCDYFRHK